jgi:hypothetical protein
MSIIIKKIPKPIYSRINVADITEDMLNSYPVEFKKFCITNNIRLPGGNGGKALATMLNNRYKYFTSKDAVAWARRFNIPDHQANQFFNKKGQTFESCNERGKNYVCYPYKVSDKKAMRKDFKYDGDEESKNNEIDKIKKHIQGNYIDPPYASWQLGHKNPETTDNTSANLVLQPPIQAKYRDRFIFIDTLTKTPTPKELFKLIKNGKSPFTNAQLRELRDGLNKLNLD